MKYMGEEWDLFNNKLFFLLACLSFVLTVVGKVATGFCLFVFFTLVST